MINIYRSTYSSRPYIYVAANLSANLYSASKTNICNLTLMYPDVPEALFDTSKWQLIATIPSLPVDPLLNPELLL